MWRLRKFGYLFPKPTCNLIVRWIPKGYRITHKMNIRMRYLCYLLLFVFQFALLTDAEAQQRRKRDFIRDGERFSAAVLVGYNSSQIDGDYFTGFDKFGWTAGVRGITRLTPRIHFNIEMLYSKKGSRIQQGRVLTGLNQRKSRVVDLTYVDAPFFFKYWLRDQPDSWHVEAGAIYSRMLESTITEEVGLRDREFLYSAIEDNFNRSEISVLGGFGHSWEAGLSINFRYVLAVTRFYDNDDYVRPRPGSPNRDEVEFLRNYFYSLSISYTLFRRDTKNRRKRRR